MQTHPPTRSPFFLLRNMRAGSNSQAGKAVVDSSLDLEGLGYFYFPESHGGKKRGEVEGSECVRGCSNPSTNVRQRPVTGGRRDTHSHTRKTHTLINTLEKAWRAIQRRNSSLSVSSDEGRSDVRARREQRMRGKRGGRKEGLK